MTLNQLREFSSHLSDDTLQHIESAAARETIVSGVTPAQRDRGYSVMYAIRCVYFDRDLAERLARAETNY